MAPLFDVPAKRPPESDSGEPAWLVYCKRCAFHSEMEQGRCWKGCPECGEPLWLTLPEGSTFRLPTGPERHMRADQYDKLFRAARRKNSWRTAPINPAGAAPWTPA